MKINIRERYQKVAQHLKEKSNHARRAIAEALNISKSSVQRHISSRARRNRHPESYFWETAEGEDWLRLLVFGAIYHFGIKGGIGSDSLAKFFQVLRLNEHVGVSASALRELEVQFKTEIIEYEQAQSAICEQKKPDGICVGTDETFFGLPILVAIELFSGFIFSEAVCENRTYETWWKQVSSWFDKEKCNCHFMVSDGAKALVKLALSGLDCPHVPDLFHLLRALSKSLGAAIAVQQARLHKQQPSDASESAQEIIATQRLQVETDYQEYQQSLHGLSQALHPFHIDTGESQMEHELPSHLQPHLSTLERLATIYAPTKSISVLASWKRQIPAMSGLIHAWWEWVLQSLSAQALESETRNWVLDSLLPWVYWSQQTEKTRQPLLKQSYAHAAQLAYTRLLADNFTPSLTNIEQQQWVDWAVWLCSKFQRTSSAVEGRNGYLARLHHSNRGFTQQTLKVLTIIHNFDVKRDDASSPAQRLFRHDFPDLFLWVLPRMRPLPSPRSALKTPKPKKLTL
jgi:hypothetical protein